MLNTIKVILKAAEEVKEKVVVLEQERKGLIESAWVMCKQYDICPVCLGKGDVYNEYLAQSNSGDPYHRSSDDREKCPTCNGSGKYMGGGFIV